MFEGRLIPTLLMRDGTLVKTRQFDKSKVALIGDPCNSLRIFNELNVDELFLLDIGATSNRTSPNYRLIREIACECFMPVAYGGGITSVDQAERVIACGIEKVVINTAGHTNPSLFEAIAAKLGSQATVASVDYTVKRQQPRVISHYGAPIPRSHRNLENWLTYIENMGAGEILLTNVDREGMWSGIDHPTLAVVASKRKVPLIYHGGVRSIAEAREAMVQYSLGGVAVGNLVVYSAPSGGVLVHVPAS